MLVLVFFFPLPVIEYKTKKRIKTLLIELFETAWRELLSLLVALMRHVCVALVFDAAFWSTLRDCGLQHPCIAFFCVLSLLFSRCCAHKKKSVPCSSLSLVCGEAVFIFLTHRAQVDAANFKRVLYYCEHERSLTKALIHAAFCPLFRIVLLICGPTLPPLQITVLT